ncbi:hypothetical protein LOK49_Contig151G00003 [Camellia lanceoleosa]|nr:hypothetical protein LOK49_Contig151G00003 [Camellia lanceoleosa]
MEDPPSGPLGLFRTRRLPSLPLHPPLRPQPPPKPSMESPPLTSPSTLPTISGSASTSPPPPPPPPPPSSVYSSTSTAADSSPPPPIPKPTTVSTATSPLIFKLPLSLYSSTSRMLKRYTRRAGRSRAAKEGEREEELERLLCRASRRPTVAIARLSLPSCIRLNSIEQNRCIAVTTTLSEETLKTASPSLIRQEIGSVSLDDILSGGSGCHSM